MTALELMVLFDIKIKQKVDSTDILGNQNYIPSFEPDISNIVTFGNGKKF